jgi:hypothetical protein
MASNEMNHSLLKKFILAEVLAPEEQDFSLMIEGPHGIGKSAIITEVCLEQDGFLIDLRLGQRDLGDILGMPAIIDVPDSTKNLVVDKRFQHIKPDLIRNAFVKDLKEIGLMGDETDVLSKLRDKSKIGKPYKFIAFFADEYNRGTKDVQQAMFELVYDRRMSGCKINPSTFIAAACNDNMEIYTVTEGDPAFRSRFKTVKYAPTVDEWLKWGRTSGELCEELIHTISTQKNLADPPKKQDIDFLNQPHPNRRSWHHFSKFYVRNRDKFSETEMRDCAATFVGGDAAEIFRLCSKKMKDTIAKKEVSVTAEAGKTKDFFENYVRYMKWDKNTAKSEMSKFNASELTALEELITQQFGTYKYITKAIKERIAELVDEVLPKELFARVWVNVNNQYDFKGKMVAELTAHGKPDYFEQFEKLASKKKP